MDEVNGESMVIDNSILLSGRTDNETLETVKALLENLVTNTLEVAGKSTDIELKGKKARRQRQAELAKMRATTSHNESLFGPLFENVIKLFKRFFTGEDSNGTANTISPNENQV
mmetsp:Transcript_17570/g.21290  ORF Transcript_17570/g.21290 Transcript_17570/m.21290 type:complete len:114 (+) Transcript_17570:841-1182(+)